MVLISAVRILFFLWGFWTHKKNKNSNMLRSYIYFLVILKTGTVIENGRAPKSEWSISNSIELPTDNSIAIRNTPSGFSTKK